MGRTINGVFVQEMVADHGEGADLGGGPSAERSYFVPNWSDRFTVANGLLGVTVAFGGSITHTPGDAYPDSPNMVAMSVRIRGCGAFMPLGPGPFHWQSAIVQTTYGTPGYAAAYANAQNNFDPMMPLIYASQTLQSATQVVEAGAGTIRLGDGPGGAMGTVLARATGIPVGIVNMTLTLFRYPYIIPSTSRYQVGSINATPFFGCEAGKLMLLGFDSSDEFDSGGNVNQTLVMSFQHRPVAPHDYLFHPYDSSKGWVKQYKADGSSILPSYEFGNLIPTAYRGSSIYP